MFIELFVLINLGYLDPSRKSTRMEKQHIILDEKYIFLYES
jgi:hypothetical protein